MERAAGIILAGGRSRRMGTEKALLPLPGHTQTSFVEQLATTLRPLLKEVVLVARDAAHAAAFTLPDVCIVTDYTPDIGPLMGLYSGLQAIHAPHALVVAVDMPFVSPALVSLLLSLEQEEDTLLVPLVQGVPQVLLAVYPRSILPIIEQLLQEGRRDPRALLERAPVYYVEEAQLRLVDPQLRSFINLNTPDELRQIQSLSPESGRDSSAASAAEPSP